MLEQIPADRRHKAIRLLHFLVYSDRVLIVAEVVDVVAVRLGDKDEAFDARNRMSSPIEIVSFCPSLVLLVEDER